MHMTLPDGWAEGLNAPKTIVRLRKARYVLEQALLLWHDDINAIYILLDSYNPQPIAISVSATMVFCYFCMSKDIQGISTVCYESCDGSQCETLRDVKHHKPRPDAPMPQDRDTPQCYQDQFQSESLYHHNPQMIR
jgi:hypothetical protein